MPSSVLSVPFRHPAVAVPASLHASLMARLDRLGSAKEMAQIGAVIGREFSHALLAAVARKAGAGTAIRARPCHCSRSAIPAGRAACTPLICSSTHWYRMQLTARCCAELRRALHGRIASALEESFADIAENQPELLAKHCTEAGLDEQAIRYWRTAGEKAVRRASNREAIGHFRQALALNQKQAPDVDRSLTELAILSQLGPALMSVHGWSAPEVGTAFERAEHLARELKRSTRLSSPLGWTVVVSYRSGSVFTRRRNNERAFQCCARLLMIQTFYSKHIIARGQFAGFAER